MANDTAFRAGRFLQGPVTQDFAGCGPGNPPGFAGAAAGPGVAVTAIIQCNPSAIDACPSMKGCQSQPPTALCTQTPELCPTFCGPACQTPQPNCTSINCTQAGPQCPPQTIAPPCPVETNVILDCTFGCTQFGPACPPTPFPQCANVTSDLSCQTVVQPQAVGAAARPNTAATVCTQYGPGCHTYPNGDCTFFGCGPGGGGGQTAATVCTQFGHQCQSAVDACPTRLCGGGGAVGAAAVPGTWPTPQTRCFVCDPVAARGGGGGAAGRPNTAATVCTQYGPGCHTYPNGDCTFFGCGPGGGGGQTAATVCTQFGHQCQSAVDACPTRLCGGGGAVGAAAVPGTWPTPQTRCFVCDPVAARGGGGGGQTAATVCTQFGHQCRSAVDACPTRLCGQQAVGTWPTPATRCFIC